MSLVLGYPKIIPMPSLNTLGSFIFELCCKQTDGPERTIHADRQSRFG